MGEFGHALGLIGAIRGCFLIKNPAGTYSYVGRVPSVLRHKYIADGRPLSAEDARAVASCGAGFFRSRITVCTWKTPGEALAAAAAAGVEPENASEFK